MPAIDVHALVAIALIFALGVMSPGPNFMVVAQRSVACGRTDGLATVLGVVTVSGLWAAASLFGIGVLFALFPWARVGLRIVGAVYLLWLGVKMWRHAHVPLTTMPVDAGGGFRRAYRAGLATNLSNAKAIAFYTSVFSAAAPAPGRTLTLWLALALVLVIALVWYGMVAVALSSGPVAAAYRRAKAPVERACGVLMIGFGAKLAAG